MTYVIALCALCACEHADAIHERGREAREAALAAARAERLSRAQAARAAAQAPADVAHWPDRASAGALLCLSDRRAALRWMTGPPARARTYRPLLHTGEPAMICLGVALIDDEPATP